MRFVNENFSVDHLFSLNMEKPKVVEATPDLSDGSNTITPDAEINEASLLRKIDAKLLPAVGILYLLSFLDRSNGEALHRQS